MTPHELAKKLTEEFVTDVESSYREFETKCGGIADSDRIKAIWKEAYTAGANFGAAKAAGLFRTP